MTSLSPILEHRSTAYAFPPMRLDTLQTIFDLEESVYFWMIQRFPEEQHAILHEWFERLFEGTFHETPIRPCDTHVLPLLQEAFVSYLRYEAP